MFQNYRLRNLVAATIAFCLVAAAVPSFAAPAGKTVNINNASLEQLQLLPRIGPSVAARIVEHREKNGQFKAVEDLMLVRGIGEATFTGLKAYIATSGATTLDEKIQLPRQPKADAAGKS